MYKQCARQLLRQRILAGQQIRFKATSPSRPPRADIWSIPGTIRELLPEPKPRTQDPDNLNSPPRKRRGPLFYLAIVSPLFIWLYLEQHFDARPLLEKKRKRVLRGRLSHLRERSAGFSALQFNNGASVVAYVRLLLDTMLPEDLLRHMRLAEILALWEQDGVPDDLLAWLREVSSTIYELSRQTTSDEELEVKLGETIQGTADNVLRKCYLAAHQSLPPIALSGPETHAAEPESRRN